MRLGINLRFHQDDLADRGTMIAAYKAAERIGFDGIWFFDAVGRGSFHLDPLIGVSVAAAVTEGQLPGPGVSLPQVWFGHSRGGVTVILAACFIEALKVSRKG